jgi:signal transduction histidine kinase
MQEVVKSGKNISAVETVRRRKDGSLIDISLSLSTIRNEQGEMIAVAAISRDITERKLHEELLRKSEKLSVVGQLAAGVAHEIRNPLTTLKGFIQFLKEDQKDNSNHQ